VQRMWLALAVLCILPAVHAAADTARQIADRADPLVRTLEALYASSMEVALTGDLETYWRFRTTSSRNRPPLLDRQRLPLFAQMLPPLGSLKFLRMDVTRGVARSLYRWPREDMVRYTLVVYRIEQKEWKIDSVLVRTDKLNNPREAQLMEELRRRAATMQNPK
jgi:hypothetical protein